MNIQQAINLRLLDEFARRGITFAYPTPVDEQFRHRRSRRARRSGLKPSPAQVNRRSQIGGPR